MDAEKSAILRILKAIDWKKVRRYHKQLGIVWEFEDVNGEPFKRVPTQRELKKELQQLLEHVSDESLSYISHGSWIVFWDREGRGAGDIRVIFRLADFFFEEDKNSMENLEFALQRAIEKEDYEAAASIRDELKKRTRINV